MSLTNVAYNPAFGWADPGVKTLEAQMLVPMLNEHPIEMGRPDGEDEIVAAVPTTRGDRPWFEAAFPGDRHPVSLDNIVRAIAAFERTLLSADSPFDRYLYRDDSAISESPLRGMKLFFSKRLGLQPVPCRLQPFGPGHFCKRAAAAAHVLDTGLYDLDGRGVYPGTDRGLMNVTKRPADMGRFRAPTLRNVALTAPYMHDGSIPTLQAAIAHYASGGRGPLRADQMTGFTISSSESADSIAFLNGLSDTTFITNPALSDPAHERR